MQAPKADSSDTSPPPRLLTLGGITLVSSPLHEPNALLGPGKPVALLLYLHSAPNRTASRDHLTDLLWADLDPVAARHALRQTLWYLRQRLGAESLRTDNGDIVLALNLTCDREEFVAAVSAGNFEDAVALYRGHFLPDFAVPGGLEFEYWADAERTRLRLMFLRTAESLVRSRLSAGHVRVARGLALRVRDANLQSEAAWRLYLETLIASHETVAALAEAERMATVLQREGRTPEPATRALLRLIQKEPEPTAAPATGLVAELVGREREFAAIVESWEVARTGRTTLLHVAAGAGMGKTRLLADTQARLLAAGAQCVYVRANPGERTVAYAFLAELAARIASLSGAMGVSPDSAKALVALNPALSSVYSQSADPTSGDEAARRRTLALTELIRAVADDAAIAILVDDLHWVDPASQAALYAALGRLTGERLLVVTTTRPVPGTEPLPQARRLDLPPLTVEQVAALLASLGTVPDEFSADLARLVLDASGGSPLLALESLQATLDAGLLELRDGRWRSPDPVALTERFTRGSALRDRVAQLERNQAWLLLLLSTAGLPVSTETIALAAGRASDAVAHDLLELERRGFVQRAHDGWEPAHDAIAEAAAADATGEAHRAAAGALGRAMVRDPAPPNHVVARAAQLLFRSDEATLRDVFQRWVRLRRGMGDRRSPATLAAELLGGDHTSHAKALAQTLPLHVRLGTDSPARVAAIAIPLAALFTAAHVVLTRPHPEPPDAVLVAFSEEGTWRTELHRDAWDPRDELQLRRTRQSLVGVAREGRAGAAIGPAPDGRSWIVEHVFPDSGGMDLVQVFTDGRPPRRLTDAPGDDGAASWTTWAPDGSTLAFTTARWSDLSHYDLALYDIAAGTVRQLTGSDAADAFPAWSPDGSRIAFSRKYFDGSAPSLCRIAVDASDLQCRATSMDETLQVMGWVDAARVVVQWDSVGMTVWDVVEVESGARLRLAAARGARGLLSGDGHWMLARGEPSGVSEPQWFVFPVDRPAAIRVVTGEMPPEAYLLWSAPTRPSAWLAGLRIQPPGQPIPLRSQYRLRAFGRSAENRFAPAPYVRWHVGDSSLATVDAAGVLRPRRTGRTVVIASAGGWRADTATVEIADGGFTTVLEESWEGGIDANWVPWGTPHPMIELLADGSAALWTGGDSSYDSGVYSRIVVPATEGMGVEVVVSGTRTLLQWQRHGFGLYGDLDSAWLATWDHRTAGLDPVDTDAARRCYGAYPAAEGAAGSGRVTFGCGLVHISAPTPVILEDGNWHRIRLQLMPDGRLGLATDGIPVGITSSAAEIDRPFRVVLSGQSFGARMLMGEVRVWTGVRDDIDWREVR